MQPIKTPTRVLSAYGTDLGSFVKGIWFWTTSRITTDADRILGNCSTNHINTMYLQWNASVDATSYKTFISKANLLGIKVHALLGDPHWALTSYQNTCLSNINAVITYNTQASSNERFVGIQLDNEPYLLTSPLDWNNVNNRAEILREWLQTSSAYVSAIRGAGLEAGATIPFWLDDSQTVLDAVALDTANLSNFYQRIIDVYDYVAVMAYRDSDTGILSLITAEMSYPTTPKIVIGIETTAQTPSNITFYEEGYQAAEAAILSVHTSQKSLPSYKGMAVHDYEQWELFFEPNKPKTPVQILTPTRILN